LKVIDESIFKFEKYYEINLTINSTFGKRVEIVIEKNERVVGS
jgi:hypothetical protein